MTRKKTLGVCLGRFNAGAPAAVMQDFGRGKAVYVGTYPGLSYLRDAGFVPAELKERYPLVLANFTYRPNEGLTVRVPLVRPLQVVRSVEQGPLPFTEERASPALRVQGYHSVAVFTTRLGLNDIIPLE